MWIFVSILWSYGMFSIKGKQNHAAIRPFFSKWFQKKMNKLSPDSSSIESQNKIRQNPLQFFFYYTDTVAMEDLFSFANELPDAYVISAKAPYDHSIRQPGAINFDADQNKFSDNEQAKSSRDLIAGFIDELTSIILLT
jgi:hypothetical protein